MSIRQFCILCFTGMFLLSCQKDPASTETGTVKITIKNMVKTDPLVLNSGTYTNSFGEQYTVSKFKYYISNVSVTGTVINPINGNYY